MADDIAVRPATSGEAEPVAALINSAYRGESSRAGWTTEADFLEGLRTTPDEVRSLIERDGSVILVCERDGAMVGCVHLLDQGTSVYLGMLVVRPDLQAAGIGKAFMAAAEDFARRTWNATAITMTVITRREELIAFYERRGYRRTGRLSPFPAQALSTPTVENLTFEELRKDFP